VDATRGLRDYADDLAAIIAALGLSPVHLDQPERFLAELGAQLSSA
jgi:hypothetical protein